MFTKIKQKAVINCFTQTSEHSGEKLMTKIIKQASEAFSLVMKTPNCLRLCVLTRNMCPHLMYMSSTGVQILNWRMCPHLAYRSSPSECVLASNRCVCLSVPSTMSPSTSWVCAQKNHTPTIPCSSPIKASMKCGRGVDRCHYAAFQCNFNKVHTRKCSFI